MDHSDDHYNYWSVQTVDHVVVGGRATQKKGIAVLWHSGSDMSVDLCCFEPGLIDKY